MTKKAFKPFGFSVYYIQIMAVALIGFADTVYLSISHYRVYVDIGYKSFCAISKAINCDTVSQSPYSILLDVPVPVWGLLGYSFILFLLFMAANHKPRDRFWPLIFWISLLFSLYSIVLGAISAMLINSYCIMCILSYLVNFLLVYYAWFINRRFSKDNLFSGAGKDIRLLVFDRQKLFFPVILIFAALSISLILWMPKYWDLQPPALSTSVPTGITEEGHPWIGAENPELTIIEFTDYLCFQCRKMHFYLRHLVDMHPEKIRLIHLQYPMDHRYNPVVSEPYHQGAGKLALFAIYAEKQGKFWQANDYFFQMDPKTGAIGIPEIAKALHLDAEQLRRSLQDPHIISALQQDIIRGLKLGISGTPGYLIDEKVYQGQIPPEIFKKVLR